MEDSCGREINYLRLSLTDRCDFRCRYCMPEDGIKKLPQDEILSYEEIVKLVRAATQLGIKKVRLTGGEPLTRKNLPGLVRMINEIEGIEDLSMTTNASRLSEFAEELAEAGLDRVNISLDSMDPETFSEITRGGDLYSVLSGIKSANNAGLNPVKLNSVIMKKVNESEILPLIEFAVREDIVLRFIELMPMGEAASGTLEPLPLNQVKRIVKEKWALEKVFGPEGNGPAEYYRATREEAAGTVGFIFPLSQTFCENCNRIRVTAQGNIRPCLARDEEYKLSIDEDTSIRGLAEQLSSIIRKKPYGHRWEEERETTGEMSEIGG